MLLYGGISAALWDALLLVAGAALARNADDLELLFSRYTALSWALLALLVAGLAASVLRRPRQGARP